MGVAPRSSSVVLIVLLTVLTHSSFKGSKVLVSLFALELGATPLAIGLLFATYSLFPMVLAVYAGKLSDRYGMRRLMIFGACGLVAGLLVPFMWPQLAGLAVSAALIGICYIFYTIAVQHVIGALGGAAARTRNYSIFSLGVGFTALIGPTTAGFAIDLIGHRSTYLLLATLPTLPILVLVLVRELVPAAQMRSAGSAQHRLADLIRDVPLRRALLAAGIVESGLELFNFFLPIYARSLGFSASAIGLIMATFAVALLAARACTGAFARRFGEERVLSVTLYAAGAICLVFPSVSGFPALLGVSFALGLALGPGSPLTLVLAYNRAPPARAGEAIGVRQTMNKVAETVMPIVFGTIGTLAGVGPVFWTTAVTLALGARLTRSDGRGSVSAARARSEDERAR
jgi:MFS family permease